MTLSVDLGQISVPDQRPTGPETVLRDSVAVRDRQLLEQPEWLLRITICTERVENVAVIQTSESGNMDDIVPVETHENHGDTTAKVVNPVARDKVVTELL